MKWYTVSSSSLDHERNSFDTPLPRFRVHARPPPRRGRPTDHRLLASSRDELARVTARVAELTEKHEVAKTALKYFILAAAVYPLPLVEALRGTSVAAAATAAAAGREEGGGEGVRSRGSAAVAVEGQASRRPAARGTGAGGAAVELMGISSAAADMEEGRSL